MIIVNEVCKYTKIRVSVQLMYFMETINTQAKVLMWNELFGVSLPVVDPGFLRGGINPRGVTNLLLSIIFAENCVTMKRI